jgi:CRISPR system Cascade subunit CasB
MAGITKAEQVKLYVSAKLNRLLESPQSGQTKALLANLRRGIGCVPGDLPELWGVFLQDLPESMQSSNGYPTREEWAIYTTLTLFALHQQGQEIPMNKSDKKFGEAVRELVPPGDDDAMDRIRLRFNVAATSDDIREAAYRLRELVQLLRAKNIPLDYPLLASDLYEYQFPDGAERVRLRWGQDFYRNPHTNNADEKSDI